MELSAKNVITFLQRYGVHLNGGLRVVDMGPVPKNIDDTKLIAVIPTNAFTSDEELQREAEDAVDEVENALQFWDGDDIFVYRALGLYISNKALPTSVDKTSAAEVE